jgi:predicted transcriptional regulator of viral defense system
MRDRTSTPSRDAAVAAVASRQEGVVSTAQLRAAGLDANAVHRRVRSGRLHPLGGGVYAVGHTALSPRGRLFAAVLGAGEGAVISHRSAGALWGFLPSAAARIDVLTARRLDRRPGVVVHRTRSLPADEVVVVDDLPLTSVARTLVDLAAVVDHRRLQRAVHEAEVLRLLDVRAVETVLARSSGRRGTGRLRALVHVPAAPTKSELERRFVALCADAGLPPPAVNTRLGRFRPDFLWAPERLVVETDGAATHDTRRGFERDRRKDVELAKAGFHVVRFTWQRVVGDPEGVANDVRALLAMRAALLGVEDRSRWERSIHHTAA